MRSKILVTFIWISTCNIVSAQTGWIQQSSGTSEPLFSVFFINNDTGFVTGDNGTLLRTSNGGNNWQQLNLGTSLPLYSIHFPAPSTGFIGSLGRVLRTTNSGGNWTVINLNLGSSVNLLSIHFPTIDTGYAVGFRFTGSDIISAIVRSRNSGITWDSTWIIPASTSLLHSVYFINAVEGVTVGSNKIMYTHDGSTWFNTGSSLFNYRSVHFPSADTGYIVGGLSGGLDTNIILKSTNGVQGGWIDSMSGWGNNELYTVYFPAVNTGYAAGRNGLIMKTSNGGNTWDSLASGVTELIYSIYFVNSQTGYAVGYNGMILKTTSGGVIGIKILNQNVPINFSLEQNYPNPFNPTTKIKFALPKSSFAKIVVYDMLGRELETIVNEQLNAGTYEADWSATGGADKFASGVYYYKFVAGDYSETRKMVLMK